MEYLLITACLIIIVFAGIGMTVTYKFIKYAYLKGKEDSEKMRQNSHGEEEE
jgi:hypothetical protein